MHLFLYNIFFFLSLPILLLHICYKALSDSTYLKDLKSRFGFSPCSNDKPLWIHAVSLGEVVGVEPLVRILEKNHSIVITVSTGTGYKKAKEIFSQHSVAFAPWDFFIFIRIFLHRASPSALIIFETEIWPNMILQSKKFGKKIILVNGRLNQKSFQRYQKVQGLLKRTLDAIDLFCLQTSAHQKRFEALGAASNKIRVYGSMKFDMNSRATNVFDSLGEFILLASTHHNEEEEILKVLVKRTQFLRSRIVICPRHPERASEILNFLSSNNHKASVLSNITNLEGNNDQFIIIDAIGHMHSLYKSAQICVLGGSFFPHGGHNIIEPALHDCPVISGPYFFNFESIFQDFIEAKACLIAKDYDDLLQLLNSVDDLDLKNVAAHAHSVVEKHRGSSAKQAQAIMEMMQE